MLSLSLGALAVLSAVVPALAETLCNIDSPCPARAPCCSPYGFCGTAAFCLGGCNPLYSNGLTSCKPQPVCESLETSFTNDLARVLQDGKKYDGNASAWDWIVEKGKIEPVGNNGVRLLLTKDGDAKQGTLISSTRYVHYGLIEFVFQASKWPGVVSAAITMSDVKDEIDWEWVSNDIHQVQSNYFFLGHANYSASNGGTHDVASTDTSSNFHTYTLNWQRESLQWMIDGNVVREVQKADTLAPDGTYKYPTTPARVQVSIWPAGIEGSAPGTVKWAGGMIDWAGNGYAEQSAFYNTLKSVRIDCSDAVDHAESATGYVFVGNDTQNIPAGMVDFTNKTTTLHSGSAASARPPYGWGLVVAGLALAFV